MITKAPSVATQAGDYSAELAPSMFQGGWQVLTPFWKVWLGFIPSVSVDIFELARIIGDLSGSVCGPEHTEKRTSAPHLSELPGPVRGSRAGALIVSAR